MERNPASAGRRAVVAEVIDQLPENDKFSVKVLATELADALKRSADAGPVGLDIGVLEAARVQLGTINVHERVSVFAPPKLG